MTEFIEEITCCLSVRLAANPVFAMNEQIIKIVKIAKVTLDNLKIFISTTSSVI